MTAIELERKKAQLLRDIDSEELLNKVKSFIRREKKKYSAPCQYTINELNNRLNKAEEEAQKGGGTEHDKFMTEVESWL